MLAVVVVAAGCVVAALLAWPAGAVGASPSGLASVSLPGFSGRIEHVSVTGPDGKTLPYVLRGDTVWPRTRLAAGERVTVTVDVRRPGWIGWLVGGSRRAHVHRPDARRPDSLDHASAEARQPRSPFASPSRSPGSGSAAPGIARWAGKESFRSGSWPPGPRPRAPRPSPQPRGRGRGCRSPLASRGSSRGPGRRSSRILPPAAASCPSRR